MNYFHYELINEEKIEFYIIENDLKSNLDVVIIRITHFLKKKFYFYIFLHS